MTKTDKTGRNGGRKKFILGARGFARISAVEGIAASERLLEDLRRLKNVSPETRRVALAAIYGVRK